ncbi:MAG: hypothetical protein MSS68_07195, partial [Clostridiales bacterium]|nr:hypothetical protein [Clostridiales bacterium]
PEGFVSQLYSTGFWYLMLLLFQSKDGSQTVSHPNIFFRTDFFCPAAADSPESLLFIKFS